MEIADRTFLNVLLNENVLLMNMETAVNRNFLSILKTCCL